MKVCHYVGKHERKHRNNYNYLVTCVFLCLKAKGFEMTYLEKVPEVKDTVHKQSLLHHACSVVVENFPQSTDLYSEIGAITRSAKVGSALTN